MSDFGPNAEHVPNTQGVCLKCGMRQEEREDFSLIRCDAARDACLPLQVPGLYDAVLARQRGLILIGLWSEEKMRRQLVSTGSTAGWCHE